VSWPLDDEEIPLDSTRAVMAHPLGRLFADLDALDLVRLHRLHLVLVGIDEVTRLAAPSRAASPD